MRPEGVGGRRARAHRMAGALRIWRVPRTAGVTGIQACSSRRPARRGKRERNGSVLTCLAWVSLDRGAPRQHTVRVHPWVPRPSSLGLPADLT